MSYPCIPCEIPGENAGDSKIAAFLTYLFEKKRPQPEIFGIANPAALADWRQDTELRNLSMANRALAVDFQNGNTLIHSQIDTCLHAVHNAPQQRRKWPLIISTKNKHQVRYRARY